MTYEEVVKKAKQALKGLDISAIKGHTAIEVDIEGEGEGAFYIELDDGMVKVEPYDYYDNNIRIRASANNLIDLLTGKLSANAAVEAGQIRVEGGEEKLYEIMSFFR